MDGVKGQCYCIWVDCFCFSVEEEATKAIWVSHHQCQRAIPASPWLATFLFHSHALPSLFLCFASNISCKLKSVWVWPREHMLFHDNDYMYYLLLTLEMKIRL